MFMSSKVKYFFLHSLKRLNMKRFLSCALGLLMFVLKPFKYVLWAINEDVHVAACKRIRSLSCCSEELLYVRACVDSLA